MKVSVREFQKQDFELVVDYFLNSDTEYIYGMGADKDKLPSKDKWIQKLYDEFEKPYSEKEYFYVIWLLDDKSVGHSNINHIHFAETATMHLHVWDTSLRKKGLGMEFLKRTIPLYFRNFELQKLICEPYARNPPPNKTLPKLGFDFVKTYETVPGPINFLQEVNRYEMTKTQFEKNNLFLRY